MSAFRTIATVVVTTAGLLAAPALAASPDEAKGAPAAEDGAAKTDDAAKPEGDSAKAKAETADPKPGIPAPKALPPDIAGECAWLGKRVISLLARDDVEQADRFRTFYRDFGCREAHLGPTFRCVIMNREEPAAAADEPAAKASPEDTFTARVDRCWSRD